MPPFAVAPTVAVPPMHTTVSFVRDKFKGEGNGEEFILHKFPLLK